MAYTAIDDPSAHFQTGLLTGNAGLISLTNDGNSDLQPDFIWHKQRNGTQPHTMRDTSRGINKFLYTNLTNAEGTNTYFTSFNSDGYTINSTDNEVNGDGDTYASWQWKANGGTRTTFSEVGDNPAGGYQANTTAGFSIIDYTGTGANGTVAHGLGVQPNLVIIKNRDSAGNSWFSHWTNLLTSDAYIMYFNNTDAEADNGTGFNSTEPSSTVVSVGTNTGTNANDDKYIGYVFANVQGYSKVGSYEGNGNSDGTFVYTGFKPAFVITKRSETGTDNWHILDHKRDIDNTMTQVLQNNEPDAEQTTTSSMIDFVSNGFKCRGTGSSINTSDTDYIYMAFAEQPFVTSGGVPCTAR